MIVRVIFPVFLVSIPLLIMLLAEPSKYAKSWFYVLASILVVIAFFHSYFLQFRQYLNLNRKYASLIIQSLLQGVLHLVKASTPGSSAIDINQLPYRVNIMKPKFNISPFKKRENFFQTCLFIRQHYNMKGHPDLNFILHPGRGVAGKAYKENQVKIGDVTLMKLPGSDDWNLTQDEKNLTKDVKSIISVPIRDDEDKNRVVAVLSVDSTQDLKTTPFQDPIFQNKLEEISKTFYAVLGQKTI